ncbi:hypothetical protein [Pseudarthrobacter sp. GA104]|uniref:hypothetical protein n=1 Tax=Pseudarthrobacter sp. GA104 TaxID=2676311 RepID=UPI0018D21F96|nr:hypothetical protein [Pseudarthrobacter sp. GA104]
MLPMTPAQSWAFLALVILTILCLVWLMAQHHRTSLKRRTASAEVTPALENTVEQPTRRPAPHLVEGSTESPQGPREVYDWAVQGI